MEAGTERVPNSVDLEKFLEKTLTSRLSGRVPMIAEDRRSAATFSLPPSAAISIPDLRSGCGADVADYLHRNWPTLTFLVTEQRALLNNRSTPVVRLELLGAYETLAQRTARDTELCRAADTIYRLFTPGSEERLHMLELHSGPGEWIKLLDQRLNPHGQTAGGLPLVSESTESNNTVFRILVPCDGEFGPRYQPAREEANKAGLHFRRFDEPSSGASYIEVSSTVHPAEANPDRVSAIKRLLDFSREHLVSILLSNRKDGPGSIEIRRTAPEGRKLN